MFKEFSNMLPEHFKKTLTVFGNFKSYWLPFNDVLMTNAKEQVHKRIFDSVKAIYPHFCPKQFMSNFKTGLTNGLEKPFDFYSIKWLFLHFHQSLYGRMEKFGPIKDWLVLKLETTFHSPISLEKIWKFCPNIGTNRIFWRVLFWVSGFWKKFFSL